jgi:hypothetical protein
MMCPEPKEIPFHGISGWSRTSSSSSDWVCAVKLLTGMSSAARTFKVASSPIPAFQEKWTIERQSREKRTTSPLGASATLRPGDTV